MIAAAGFFFGGFIVGAALMFALIWYKIWCG